MWFLGEAFMENVKKRFQSHCSRLWFVSFFVSFSMFCSVFLSALWRGISDLDKTVLITANLSQVWCINWTGLGNPWVWELYNRIVKPSKWFYTDIKSSHICLFHSSDGNNFGTRYIHQIITRTITSKDQTQFGFWSQGFAGPNSVARINLSVRWSLTVVLNQD